jgi:8-oxo-dGTP diphosphatase
LHTAVSSPQRRFPERSVLTDPPDRGPVSESTSRLPRVGVGVIVLHDGLVLVGERCGAHGAGSWAFPGGHLEFGESVEGCAAREVLEETGLAVHAVRAGPYTSDLFVDSGQHYITLFMLAEAPHADAAVREPHKCAQWRWCRWSELPEPRFAPLATLLATGFIPPGAR